MGINQASFVAMVSSTLSWLTFVRFYPYLILIYAIG